MTKYNLVPKEKVVSFYQRLRDADDKKRENKFRELLNVINSKNPGELIERKDFETKTSTFDGYKRSLQIYRYLEFIRPGVYRIIRKVPEISLGELRKIHIFETRGKSVAKDTGII